MRLSTQCALIWALAAWPAIVSAQTGVDPAFGEEEELPEGDAPPEGEDLEEAPPPSQPASEPEVSEPEVSEPEVAEPEVAEPEESEPEVKAPAPEPPPRLAVPPPPPAELRPPDRVVAVVIPNDARALGFVVPLGDRAAALLAARRDLLARDLEASLEPDAADHRRERIRAGLDGVEAGQGAIEDLDLETAGATLEEAVNTLLGEYAHLDRAARGVLSRGIFAYGASTLFEGNGDQAEDIFLALALLDPQFIPAEGRFPSNVVARYAQAKASLEGRGTGALAVKTTPPGAAVHIDGAFRGYAPLEVEGLADGFHAVSVDRPFARSIGTLAPVTAERVSNLELELLPTPGAELEDRLAPGLAQDQSRALSLGRELAASHLLILRLDQRLSGQTVQGLWLDVTGQRLLARVPELSIATDPEMAAGQVVEAIEQAEAQAQVVVAPPSTPVVPESRDQGPWLWVALGGAVLVAAAATVAVVAATQADAGVPRGTAIFGF